MGRLPGEPRPLPDGCAGRRARSRRGRVPIGIKLNSSDFQKGGFTSAECIELVKMLKGTGLDLLELSGGSLEQPKVMGITLKDEGEDGPRQSTIAREAYFVNFAKQLERMGDGLEPDLPMTGEAAFAAFVKCEGRNMAALLDLADAAPRELALQSCVPCRAARLQPKVCLSVRLPESIESRPNSGLASCSHRLLLLIKAHQLGKCDRSLN
jgi:hypothetical protein